MDIGRALFRGVVGGIGGVGEGVGNASKTMMEQQILSMREENLARFKSRLDEEKEGRQDYAIGNDGSVLTKAQYEALPAEEKAGYTSITAAKDAREQRKLDISERQATASERRAEASERSAEAAMRRAERVGGERLPTEADRQRDVLSLRKEGNAILERARAGEDVSAEADWYNENATKYGLPQIGQTEKTIPGKKGLIWDDPATTEKGWGYVGKGGPPLAPTQNSQAKGPATDPLGDAIGRATAKKAPLAKEAPITKSATPTSAPASVEQVPKKGLLSSAHRPGTESVAQPAAPASGWQNGRIEQKNIPQRTVEGGSIGGRQFSGLLNAQREARQKSVMARAQYIVDQAKREGGGKVAPAYIRELQKLGLDDAQIQSLLR